jgi:uroporphyrinogen decarboxylase
MNEKQRIKSWIHFKDTDLVPWQINCTSELADRLLKELPHLKDHAGLEDYFGNHIAYVRNRGVNAVREVEPGIWKDEWGVLWDRRIDRDIGTPISWPLQSDCLDNLTVPDADDPERYAHILPIATANPDRYILSKFSYSLFERAWSLRGMENLLVDFSENQSFVHELFRAICDFNLRVMRNLSRYQIDGIYFGDDWGSQRSLLVSPEMWRKFIKPYLEEMYGQAHRQGYDVFIHSCGQISSLLDDLIDIGLNVFNPFQPEVMDVEKLMMQYSHRLAFYGSLSIQNTLPFGTRTQVQEEVRHRLALARKYGGLIPSPSHDMPRDIPLDNIIAMVDAVKDQRTPVSGG